MTTHKPETRAEFRELCLRALGKGAINIDVTEMQVEDAIETALSYYKEFHMDGTHETLLKHQITSNNHADQFITLPDNVFGIREVIDLGSTVYPSTGWLSPQYQLVWTELNSLGSVDLAPYYMTKQKLEFINQVMRGTPLIRFNHHTNKLFLDMNWSKLPVDSWIIIYAYVFTDPAVYTDVWQDRWLQKYTQAQIQLRWGRNLSKFSGMKLPGDMDYSGAELKAEAQELIEKLEEECKNKYSLPPIMMIG